MPITLSQVVSVALALVVVYYVLGLIVSAITKYALDVLETRGKILENFLKDHLVGAAEEGKALTIEKLKSMPQIDTLKPVRYVKKGLGFFTGKTEIVDIVEKIPPKNLVDALFDIAKTTQTAENDLQKFIDLLPDALPGSKKEFALKKELTTLVKNGFDDIDALRSKVETWSTGLMAQASVEFKARAKRIVFVLAFVVTFLLGVDTIELVKNFWNNAAISATADTQAALILKATDGQNTANADVQQLLAQLEQLQAINYQWYVKPESADWTWIAWKILGLLITALAVSQGSSFWYDILKQMKGENVKPPSESSVSIDSGEDTLGTYRTRRRK
jgi:hypothetical protein